ncbi:hypothetical protein GOARA_053_00480 [Gordonia araii NBRC 100433]|uniref:Uncharacterized protein n=1 Tax=Gordonia araii NBRC 100433 TaxID=1073574 RepID=G7H2Z6_9ACTN|nr:hypothetical protein [Gordonia araii]GAB10221.1 hypothetical protein GOARA_053_00480 [Gordonia araii NBRC 100433]
MNPPALSTAASNLQADNDKFEQKIDDMLREAEAAHRSWTGIGGDAALARARAEARFGREIAGQVDNVIAAFNSGAARLGSARGALLRSVDGAIADGFAVHDRDWTVKDTRPEPDDEGDRSSRETARANHEASIKANLKTLVREDEQVGFAIDSAIDETTATANDVAAGRTYRPPRSLLGMTPEQIQDLINDPRFREWVHNHQDAAKSLLDPAFDAGLLQNSEFYKKFLRHYWEREALEQAGIDPRGWDHTAGTDANKDNIRKVYEYYGQLFMDHPYMQWAGMANMIGPSFAGGFYDLRTMIKVGEALGWPPELAALKDASPTDLEFFESTLLGMQKKIFMDQASQHEAFLSGGMEEIERMRLAGAINDQSHLAWSRIDEGLATDNQAKIREGNRALLWREQHDIIDSDYQALKSHPITGLAFTYGMTVAGSPSIPGADAFSEVFPYEVTVPAPVGPFGLYGHVDTTITLPDGNIADFDSRWNLIEKDTLPAYLETVDNGSARDIVSSDFAERMNNSRIAEIHRTGIIKLDIRSGEIPLASVGLERSLLGPTIGDPSGSDMLLVLDGPTGREKVFSSTATASVDELMRCVGVVTFWRVAETRAEAFLVLREGVDQWGFSADRIEGWRKSIDSEPDSDGTTVISAGFGRAGLVSEVTLNYQRRGRSVLKYQIHTSPDVRNPTNIASIKSTGYFDSASVLAIRNERARLRREVGAS